MMDDYIDVKINVFEHTGQRAKIRRTLTVNQLIEEILKEFDDIGVNTSENYNLQLKGLERPLKPDLTMSQLDIQPQDEFTLGYAQQTIRQMLDPQHYATLREESTGKVFDIQWHPAVIGRPSTEVNHNITLAVNMQLLPTGMTISRRHAQIVFAGGKYYLEALSQGNPTYVNGKEIPLHGDSELRNGDRISLGRQQVSLIFEAREVMSSSPRRGASQPRASSQSLTPPPPPIPRPESQPVSAPGISHEAAAGNASATRVGQGDLRALTLVIERCTNVPMIGQRIDLNAYPFTLGRVVPIFATEGDVSRQHAEINFNPDTQQLTIVDLNSTNGVTLNGVKIEPATAYELVPGTKIGLGRFVILSLEA